MQIHVPAVCLSLSLMICASGAALAATTAAKSSAQPAPSAAQATYQAERKACLSLPAGDERTTCLREAGAALQAARKGGSDLVVAQESEYEKNRLARCDVHTQPEERELCLRMMKGEGTVSGSVESGGILRELTVTYVGGVESTSGVGASTPGNGRAAP